MAATCSSSRDNPEATSLMNIFVRGGLEAHSLDDLYSIFAGRAVSLNFGSGEDYLGGYLATTPDDLALQMQVLTAFTTHPGYRSEAINQYRSYLPNFYARLNATPRRSHRQPDRRDPVGQRPALFARRQGGVRKADLR